MEAYLLVETKAGKALEAGKQLRSLPGVKSADPVAGPYDLIARIEAKDINDLGKLVVEKIQATGLITKTLTCPIVNI